MEAKKRASIHLDNWKDEKEAALLYREMADLERDPEKRGIY